MKRLIFVLVYILVFFRLSGQEVKDTLVVGYASAPPFIIENNELLEGINIWLWKRVAEDLELPYKIEQMAFADM